MANNFFNLLPHCVDKTTFQLPNIWQNIDLENLAKSKPNTFNVVVYHSLKNGFQLYPHLLSKELIENNKIHRLKTYLNKLTENAKTLNKNDPIPYSNIISSSLQQGKINFLNEFLNTYNYKLSLFNNEFIRSAYESVGFAGNIKSLNYINALFSHDLTNNKNKNNTHLIDAALRTNKIEFINYCFSQGARFYQTFYQTNIINQNYCTALRRTAWEDLTLRDKPHQAQLVLTLKNLIAKYEPENLNQFIDEIKKSPAPELFEFIDKENFYNELNSTLLSKNNTNQQNTHKIKL